jgi:hypothetical protein
MLHTPFRRVTSNTRRDHGEIKRRGRASQLARPFALPEEQEPPHNRIRAESGDLAKKGIQACKKI